MDSVNLDAIRAATADYNSLQVECWQVYRMDGESRFLTSNSQEVRVDGFTYKPTLSLEFQDTQTPPGGTTTSSGAVGGYSDDFVTYKDAIAGKWRGALVEAYVYDLRNLTVGPLDRSTYYVAELRPNKSNFSVEFRSEIDKLNRSSGEEWQRSCTYTLGDPFTCKAEIAFLSDFGASVSSVTNRQRFRVTGASVASKLDGNFSFGRIQYRTGENGGLRRHIAEWTQATGEVVLLHPLPFLPVVGEYLDLIVGCDGLLGTCRGKFSNANRYPGAIDIPGPDTQNKTPDESAT